MTVPTSMTETAASMATAATVATAAVAAAVVAAAAARPRDATRLEPLVCFFFLPFFPFILMFILGPLSTSKRRWQQRQQQLETQHISSC